jgi:hypothetical protein
MKRRSKSEWQILFSEQEASGLSAVAFCRERGLNPQYFGKRRRQLHENRHLKSTSSFVPVAICAQMDTPMLVLQRGDALALKIPMSVSSIWLAELIQQLQG